MKIGRLVNRLLAPFEIEVRRTASASDPDVYDQDGLRSIHNHEFMAERSFNTAYQRGVRAAGADYHWHWRIHVGLWVAFNASKLNGDFIECGVNRGFLSSAIMEYLDWDGRNKTFYLLDTFKGMDPRFLSDAEKKCGALELNQRQLKSGFYLSNVDLSTSNFAQWKNVRIIAGAVPETLSLVAAKEVAYLHLDMNCAIPEVAALEFFWPRLVPGGFVLMDDYAYVGFRAQKLALDSFAEQKACKILSLPTGQGLLLKVK